MIRARLHLRPAPNTWRPSLSRSFPGTEFRLLSSLETDIGWIDLIEILDEEPDEPAAAIESKSAVEEFARLEHTDGRLLIRYLDTAPRDVFEMAEDASIPPEFPIILRDGWVSYDLVASRADFERFRDRLDDWDGDYELHSLVSTDDADDLLTERQRQTLETAFQAGYFEVPRESTLAEVAERLDLDKSTASGLIRRAENRILTRFLTGTGGGPRI